MASWKGDCLRVQDVEELLHVLDDLMSNCNLDCVSVVADGEVAKQLLYHAINDDGYNIGSIDLDRYNQKDAYIVTLDIDCEVDRELVIVKAKGKNDKYLATGTVTFIQKDLPCKDKYIEDVKANKYVEGFDPKYFVIGKPQKSDQLYEYSNRFEDNERFGEIFVASNISELVELMSDFFEEYFEI